MLCQPHEQRTLLRISRQIADQRAFGCVGAQLLKVRLHVLHDDSFWWSKSRGCQPLVQMRGRFSQPRFADHFVAFGARWKQLSFPS